jgi:hypothetical protein
MWRCDSSGRWLRQVIWWQAAYARRAAGHVVCVLALLLVAAVLPLHLFVLVFLCVHHNCQL